MPYLKLRPPIAVTRHQPTAEAAAVMDALREGGAGIRSGISDSNVDAP